jgi:hypothetical protein
LLESGVLLEIAVATDRKQNGLVGAVGIENNARRNFKDLEEMRGDSRTLKRNSEERKEILIGPSMAPRSFA